MKVAIYGKSSEKDISEAVVKLINTLKSYNCELIVDHDYWQQLKSMVDIDEFPLFLSKEELKNVDILISIGGDGTFLNTIHLVQDWDIKILGINAGRLGFLSSTSIDQIDLVAQSLIEDNYIIEKRSLLEFIDDHQLFGNDNYALNEISVLKKDTSSMITVEVFIDDIHLNTYWTDGLIISTSTGSTAYSLSCGGPIIMPGSGNFVITPIAPHNLNVRPIVIDDESELKLTINGRSEQHLIALDSRSKEIENLQTIRIKKAKHHVQVIQFENNSFITSLKNKLNWGLDKRNI